MIGRDITVTLVIGEDEEKVLHEEYQILRRDSLITNEFELASGTNVFLPFFLVLTHLLQEFQPCKNLIDTFFVERANIFSERSFLDADQLRDDDNALFR